MVRWVKFVIGVLWKRQGGGKEGRVGEEEGEGDEARVKKGSATL